MKKKLTLLLTPFVLLGIFYVFNSKRPTDAQATGNLFVDFPSDPLFSVENILPGDCIDRQVDVTNSGDDSADIAVRSDNESWDDNFPNVLSLLISENSVALFDNSLASFFAASFVPLSTLPASENTTYLFKLCFDETAGNQYQGKGAQFDIVFGEMLPDGIELPPECEHLEGTISKVIEGTNEGEILKGNSANELILGHGGDDYIKGGSGDDCIVGGGGDDYIKGGGGNDVIVGNEGEDKLKGGSGDDNIYGNEDDDRLYGGSGDDYLDGGADNDYLKGGTGVDTCLSGETLKTCEL